MDSDAKQSEANRWAMILHFSMFAGYIAPMAGFIAPIVIWQIKKDEFPTLDIHGRIVTNWILSELVYFGIAIILMFALIGVPLLYLLGVIAVAFPLIGGLKAANGEVWKYPGSIPFFSIK